MSEVELLDGHPVPLGFGPVDVAEIRAISGLEFLQSLRDCKLPLPTICRAMNIRFTEVGEGMVAMCGTPGENYLNPLGVVHGGFMATMLDSALGCSVHTLCPPGYGSTSIDLRVNFVRAVRPETGRLFAKATVVHPGRQIATTEGRVTDENGKLYAHGMQACSIFRLPE